MRRQRFKPRKRRSVSVGSTRARMLTMNNPATKEIPARDVTTSHEIVCRNSCGGFDSATRVTAPLGHRVIQCGFGAYVVGSPDEMVEVMA